MRSGQISVEQRGIVRSELKTPPLLTIPLLGAIPSVVLAQNDSVVLARNEVLLVRLLPKDVARLVVTAYQNAVWKFITTACPATD
jgi:hypothetical protein